MIIKKDKWKKMWKQLYGLFKQQTKKTIHAITRTWLRSGNLNSETESLLIEAQNHALSFIPKPKLIIPRRIASVDYAETDMKTINHINECSKLAWKNTRDGMNWVGKMIYWELWKRWKCSHADKWYMHKLESVPEYEMHKILLDFDGLVWCLCFNGISTFVGYLMSKSSF